MQIKLTLVQAMRHESIVAGLAQITLLGVKEGVQARFSVGDLLGNKPLGQLSRVPVLSGGPVGADQLILAAFRWHPQTKKLECRHHIALEEAESLAAKQHHTVRAFAGYAGWSAGQLDAELAQRSWLVRQADVQEVLELSRAPQIWRDLTSGFGPWFRMVAEAPDDPSLN